MLRLVFKNVNGREAYRTIGPNDKIDADATHVFREVREGQWITRARKLTGEGPYAAANYMRAVHLNGGRIELLGTL